MHWIVTSCHEYLHCIPPDLCSYLELRSRDTLHDADRALDIDMDEEGYNADIHDKGKQLDAKEEEAILTLDLELE